MSGRTTPLAVTILITILIGSVTAGGLDPNLVGWWRFDDGAGLRAADSSGNERHGELVDNPLWVDGVRDGALAFTGGNHVAVPGYDGILGSHSRTSAAWVNVSKTSASIMTWGPAGSGTKWVMRTHNGPASLRVECGQSYIFGTIDLTDGEWHHVAAILVDDGSANADEIKLYVDAVLDEIAGVRSRLLNTSSGGELRIAYDLNNTPRTYDGMMDDVRLYDRALSAEEIRALMENPVEQVTQALSPEPADGALVDAAWIILTWTAGDLAVSHDVYLGENFVDVNDATRADASVFAGNRQEASLFIGTPGDPYPDGLVPGTTYFWRVDEVGEDDTVWKGKVWSFSMPETGAWKPLPADGASLVGPDDDLAWMPGLKAIMYGVYFGDDPNTVADATTPLALITETTFEPGPMEPGKTYYWRIDQFNGTIWTTSGPWTFTVAPLGGGLKGEYFNNMDLGGAPVLTRIDPGVDFDLGDGSPEPNVVNADGFSVRWRGEIAPAFSEVYTFYTRTIDGSRLWIDDTLVVDKWAWVNRVVDTRGEPIELVAGQRYSLQMEWYNEDEEAEAHLMWESASQPKTTVPAAALSPPLKAGAPRPAKGATDVTHNPILGWISGDYAAEHDVYFGDDEEAVAAATPENADLYQGRQALEEISFDPGPLEWSKTYYWRVDEVNDLHPDGVWPGTLWSFTTAGFIVVDDFEGYSSDLNSRIFQTWLDGMGYTEPAPGLAGNGTGSLVGTATDPWVEREIVHTGSQSMPMSYSNLFTPFYSEAERAWTAPQDWTLNGVDTLIVNFRGDEANEQDSLYVMLEDDAGRTGVIVHPDPAAVLALTWQQWAIPLSDFSALSVDIGAVVKMSIGVGNRNNPAVGGSGQVYIDDVRVVIGPSNGQ